MKLPVPFVQLPLMFDASLMASEIRDLDEASWYPHPSGYAGNSMLPLISVNGDPDDEGFIGQMLPTPYLEKFPYLHQVLGAFGATLGRTRLMRLSGHAEVTRHSDTGYYWAERVRVHVPIITQPAVRFECGDAYINMAAGECWIFDTWRQHRVLNDGDNERIHLVSDTVGGDKFWQMVDAGRDHLKHAFLNPWSPKQIGFDPLLKPDIMFESQNYPLVMTPWEISTRIQFLLQEANPHPNLPAMQHLAMRFIRNWQGLWTCYGEKAEGWPHYRKALDAFMFEAQACTEKKIMLRNATGFMKALEATVAVAALTNERIVVGEYI